MKKTNLYLQRAAKSLKSKGKKDWKITIKFKFYRDDIFGFGIDTAWPRKRSTSYSPLLVFFQWKEVDDDFYVKEMEVVLRNIQALECTVGAPVYSNMALANYSKVEDVYGKDGLRELGKIRKTYDPRDVMSRVGGFRIPLSEVRLR